MRKNSLKNHLHTALEMAAGKINKNKKQKNKKEKRGLCPFFGFTPLRYAEVICCYPVTMITVPS